MEGWTPAPLPHNAALNGHVRRPREPLRVLPPLATCRPPPKRLRARPCFLRFPPPPPDANPQRVPRASRRGGLRLMSENEGPPMRGAKGAPVIFGQAPFSIA